MYSGVRAVLETSEALKVLEDSDTMLRRVGPVTEPKLVFDVPALGEEFHAALLNAGKDQLAGRLRDLLGKDKSTDKDDPEKKEEEKKDDKKDAKDVLRDIGGLIGGDKSKDKDKNDAPSPSSPDSDVPANHDYLIWRFCRLRYIVHRL